jgi:hydrogenase maturation factor
VCLGAIGQVVRVWEEAGVPIALVRTGDAELRASLLCLPEARMGDHVVVHSGLAVELLEPREAAAASALRRNDDEDEEGSA